MERLRGDIRRLVNAYSGPEKSDQDVDDLTNRILQVVAARDKEEEQAQTARKDAIEMLATAVRRSEHAPAMLKRIQRTLYAYLALWVIVVLAINVLHVRL
jgi:hypothetical protein